MVPPIDFAFTLNMSRHMTERTTVRLPEELVRQAKRKAAENNRTLTSLIEEGLRLVVSGARNPVSGTRALPRVSRATGGLAPGIDLEDSAVVQEIEDLAYAEKLKR
jgi:hypothetical protein